MSTETLTTFPKSIPTLQSARITLRPIRPSDLQVVHQGLSDRRVTRHYAVHFDTLEQAREQMHWFSRNERDGTGCWWALCDQRNPRDYEPMIGACGMNAHPHCSTTVELGFWLLPGHWGQGLARDAVSQCIQYARSLNTITSLVAYVARENVRCLGLLTGLGFTDLPDNSNPALQPQPAEHAMITDVRS
ncbi:MAG: GNAT family N-acetyltransferase [Pseudomonadota bacterium]